MADSPIYVTRPALPPLAEFLPQLAQIWDSHRLTNGGPFHETLENDMAAYLGVDHLVLCGNGTLALLLALRALGLKGEVITTPYSFVATSHAIVWAGLKPVFVDINPETFNIDAVAIEAAIGPQTAAILPVHCYGNPCEVDAIETMARRHGLPVIYDAAHAFGVQCHCGSVLNHGELATLSFHATKSFNTFEGGAVVCHDEAMRKQLKYLRNFGFENETTVEQIGINAKMSEFQAALGLLQLEYFEHWVDERAEIANQYSKCLEVVPGIRCARPATAQKPNYAYFPIRVDPDYPLSRDALVEQLRAQNIYVRRYFYPLITDFAMYRKAKRVPDKLPDARGTADAIICLPIYPGLTQADVDRVCDHLASWASA